MGYDKFEKGMDSQVDRKANPLHQASNIFDEDPSSSKRGMVGRFFGRKNESESDREQKPAAEEVLSQETGSQRPSQSQGSQRPSQSQAQENLRGEALKEDEPAPPDIEAPAAVP